MAITETGSVDQRHTTPGRKYSIARGDAKTITVLDTVGTKTIEFNFWGELLGYIYTAENLTTDATFTLQILDQDGTILFSKTDNADNQSAPPAVVWLFDETKRCYLWGNHQIKITLTTAAQGADRTFVVSPILG